MTRRLSFLPRDTISSLKRIGRISFRFHTLRPKVKRSLLEKPLRISRLINWRTILVRLNFRVQN